MDTNQSKLRFEITIDVTELPQSFKEIEQTIQGEVKKAKAELMREAMGVYEKRLLRNPCLVLKDRREKRFYTALGEISYPRYRVYDRKTHNVRYPVDEWLGIFDQGKVSESLRDELVRLAVDVPYRFVAREIQHWTGNDLNKDTIWSELQEIGQKRWQEKDKNRRFNRYEVLPKPSEIVGKKPPAEILCVGMDATYVKSQEKKRRLKTKHDVKVAVLYTGKHKRGGDRSLTDRQTVIQAKGEKLDQFLGRVVAKGIEHYGLNQNTTVLLFGDGDSWIRRFKDYIPQTHYRLDPWHVMEKIKNTFGIKKMPRSWIKMIYGNPDALIAEIRTHQAALVADPTTEQSKMEDLIQYLKNNREGLLPWRVDPDLKKRHRELFTWGSGHVESQIEIAVYDRHKQNRMSWSKNGLRNLSTLREDKLNNHQLPKYSCTSAPKSFKINLGSLGVWSNHPQ